MDKNIPVKENVFMCIDQVELYTYIINVIDQAGKVSYTRKTIESMKDLTIIT